MPMTKTQQALRQLKRTRQGNLQALLNAKSDRILELEDEIVDLNEKLGQFNDLRQLLRKILE